MNKWTPPRNSGGIPQVSTRFSLSMEMSRLTRDGTAEPVSRDQILRHEHGQENINFPCSADNEQDWQPYPVGPYSCYMCDRTYIHTYIHAHEVLDYNICIVTVYAIKQTPRNDTYLYCLLSPSAVWCLKKNQNTPRPSEHPSVMGKKCQNV